jgi:arylsulfatase A-like enzyme
MDDGIGQVLNSLRRTGAYDNTLIFFTSDNGGHGPSEANNGPYRGAKQSVYEGGIRVPTAVSWPEKIESGTSSDRILLTMDIFPTVLDAAGISYEGPLNGISFLPTLLEEGQGKYREEPLFFTRREGGMTYGGLTIQAVRLGDWKLVHNSPFAARELYNLKTDPYEEHDLIEENPEKVRELNQLMMMHLQKAGSVPWQRPGGDR